MTYAPLLDDLQARGLIAQITDAVSLGALLNKEQVTLYCGFDPTADSLHLGHLVPVLMLRRFQQAGHRPVALVGGATGMIGDPSFRASERKLHTPEVIQRWVENIRAQVEPFLSFEGDNAALIVNNYDWFGQMNTLDFLRDIGKHFSVNAMIKKESVQQRIHREDSGISFSEFSYSLLQSYDFVELNRRCACRLQIGGSDQWGNITAGINLTRRLQAQQTFGLTAPLVTKADGAKFGKTESGTIWLDARKTSPYAFYQFWLSTTDADVYKFLRYFTFLSMEEVDALEAAQETRAGKPDAQRILGEKVTALVHGTAALEAAQRITQCLFKNDLGSLTVDDLAQLAQDGVPSIQLERGTNCLIDVLAAGGLARSKSEARTFVQSGAVSVNGTKVWNMEHRFVEAERLFGRYTLLKRGKKHYVLLKWC